MDPRHPQHNMLGAPLGFNRGFMPGPRWIRYRHKRLRVQLAMASPFTLRPIVTETDTATMINRYGLTGVSAGALVDAIHNAFHDYILLSLSEASGQTTDERNRVYLEAIMHLDRADKLLQSQPHPAGPMAYKIRKMIRSLNTVMEGREDKQVRANRFVEKNLGRKLKQTFLRYRPVDAESGASEVDAPPPGERGALRAFMLECLAAAAEQYPEITFFSDQDEESVAFLLRTLR